LADARAQEVSSGSIYTDVIKAGAGLGSFVLCEGEAWGENGRRRGVGEGGGKRKGGKGKRHARVADLLGFQWSNEFLRRS